MVGLTCCVATGPRSAGVPWLGGEEDGQLQRRRTVGAFGYDNLSEQEDPEGRERSQSYQVRRTSGAIVIDAENGAKSSYEERLIPRTASSATH